MCRPYRAEGLDITFDHLLPLDTIFGECQGQPCHSACRQPSLKTELEVLRYPNYVGTNVVGQVGQAGFLADYAPTPKWIGNFTASYLNGPMTVTLQTQWTGKGKKNAELPWIDPSDAGYDPTLIGTVDDNTVGNYFNFNLNGSFDIPVEGFSQSQVFLSVNNLFDRTPPFSNGGIGGVNGTFYDTLGRTFRLGYRMKF